MIIACTGHRPDKLGGYNAQTETRLYNLAFKYLQNAKPDKVISGLALGWDTAVAKAAINLKIYLIAAAPFAGQQKRWSEKEKSLYARLIEFANEVKIVSENDYAPWKMQRRNEWMCDQLTGDDDQLLGLWNGSAGDTANCVLYYTVVKKGANFINLWEKYKLQV